MKKRILACLLAVLMVVNLGACKGTASKDTADVSGGSTETGTADSAKEEAVELRVLSLPANSSGVQEGWWADEVEKAVGVKLNLLPSGDQGEQKLQAMMASGDLPDIIVFKDYKQVENAVAGNMLLAYDDYKDSLPNLYANAATSLRYYADNVSMGQGKSYGVGVKIKTDPETKGDVGPYIRYDLYKKVGAPKLNTFTDLLDVLKKMQDAEPANADGQKVYGLSIWKDWDRSYMTLGMFAAPIMGNKIPDEGCLAEINNSSGQEKVESILSEDSSYMKFLRFLYDANQMGLLDPDSITQRFDDAVAKTTAGRVLFTLDGWGASDFSTMEKQNQGIGFMPISTGDKRLLASLQPVGVPWTMSVSANSKNAEKAMEFIDWNYSYEGARVSTNGPKGVMWDVDANNKPYLTEKYYENQLNPEEEFADGKTYIKGAPQINALGFWGSAIDPGNGAAISSVFWDKPSYAPEDTKLKKEWQSDFGAEDMISYLNQDESRYAIEPVSTYPALNDDMEQISSRAGDIIKTASWKMVFAKDEAEFNSLKEKMIADCDEVGIKDFVDWYAAEYAKAKEAASKYAD